MVEICEKCKKKQARIDELVRLLDRANANTVHLNGLIKRLQSGGPVEVSQAAPAIATESDLVQALKAEKLSLHNRLEAEHALRTNAEENLAKLRAEVDASTATSGQVAEKDNEIAELKAAIAKFGDIEARQTEAVEELMQLREEVARLKDVETRALGSAGKVVEMQDAYRDQGVEKDAEIARLQSELKKARESRGKVIVGRFPQASPAAPKQNPIEALTSQFVGLNDIIREMVSEELGRRPPAVRCKECERDAVGRGLCLVHVVHAFLGKSLPDLTPEVIVETMERRGFIEALPAPVAKKEKKSGKSPKKAANGT